MDDRRVCSVCGFGSDGQAPGLFGGAFPFVSVGHGLGEGLFSLLVHVTQGPVAGGQGLMPVGAVTVACSAGGCYFGVSPDGTQPGVEGSEPG